MTQRPMTHSPIQIAVLAEARTWLGTPYIHQCSAKGAGTDCLGLIRGIWRAVIGDEPQAMPEYSRDWGEVGSRETMLEAGRRWFEEVPISQAIGGDLLVFRWQRSAIAKHAGILSTQWNSARPTFIHAYEKAGVVETTLGRHWQTRIAAAFRFPKQMGKGT